MKSSALSKENTDLNGLLPKSKLAFGKLCLGQGNIFLAGQDNLRRAAKWHLAVSI